MHFLTGYGNACSSNHEVNQMFAYAWNARKAPKRPYNQTHQSAVEGEVAGPFQGVAI